MILVIIIYFLLSNKNYVVDFSKYQLKDDLILNITIDGQLCSYDKEKNVFYYSSGDNNYKKWKVGVNSLYDVDYYLSKEDDNHLILNVYNDHYYQKVDIFLTPLPIIDLQDLDFNSYLSSNLFSYDYDISLFNEDNTYKTYYAKFNNTNVSPYYTHVNLKTRGSSSLLFPKKTYKIEFDEKVSIYGLPKDDKYVLDALYIDKSKIRNLLSTNMWNLINNNQSIDDDLQGQFVELFIDNEYMGLYVLKEKVDKSVTKISDSGILLKTISHMNDYYIGQLHNYDYSINDNSFLNFEIKKYNVESFYSIVDKLKNYYSCYSYDCIYNDFDIDNYINYIVFVSLISGNDNLNYNRYLSLHDADSKIIITPWDMDLTWGLNWWDFSELYSLFYMPSSYDADWMDDNIISNMDEKTLSLIKQRYWELRENIISMDTINGFLDAYKDLLVKSGAASRDSERWYSYDVEYEIEQIREWANYRIQFLDEYFK